MRTTERVETGIADPEPVSPAGSRRCARRAAEKGGRRSPSLQDVSSACPRRSTASREPRMCVAVLALSLPALVFELTSSLCPQTRETIERYCERFEKDMLRLFDRYYRKGDPKAMAVRPPPSRPPRSARAPDPLALLLRPHSIARRPCRTSTAVSRASRSTSTSTTSSSRKSESRRRRAGSSAAPCASLPLALLPLDDGA